MKETLLANKFASLLLLVCLFFLFSAFLCVNYAPVTSIVLLLEASTAALPPLGPPKIKVAYGAAYQPARYTNSRLPLRGAGTAAGMVCVCVCVCLGAFAFVLQSKEFWFIFTAETHKQMRRQITNPRPAADNLESGDASSLRISKSSPQISALVCHLPLHDIHEIHLYLSVLLHPKWNVHL